MSEERVPVPEPADLTDQELARMHREWWAELSQCEDELELCPANHPLRSKVLEARDLAWQITDLLLAEIKSRKSLYDAVAAVFEESHR